MRLDIATFIAYNVLMMDFNILNEFTAFLDKSAMMPMLPQQPPAAATITAPPLLTPATEGTRAQSLVSPATIAQSPPRVAAMPMDNNSAPVKPPKPVTDTSKPLKSTNFSPSK